MRIPTDAIIAREKLTRYLLLQQSKSDKSGFLATLGFTLANPEALESAIRRQADSAEFVVESADIYGEHMTVVSELIGPIGKRLVVTVWVRPAVAGVVRFITLKPSRRKS